MISFAFTTHRPDPLTALPARVLVAVVYDQEGDGRRVAEEREAAWKRCLAALVALGVSP